MPLENTNFQEASKFIKNKNRKKRMPKREVK